MYVNTDAVAVSLNEMNIVYFINLFTIINMLLNLTSHARSLNFNSLMIKFMITDSQSAFSTFSYVISL